jgi:hypothetical protein
MDGPWSQTGGKADPVNTVEAIFLPAGKAIAIEIQVMGTLIAGDGVPGVGDSTDQDFVLICDNCQHQHQVYFPVLKP